MPVRFQIFGEYLSDCIFHILTFHFDGAVFTANKVKPFLWKANEKEIKNAIREIFLYRIPHFIA